MIVCCFWTFAAKVIINQKDPFKNTPHFITHLSSLNFLCGINASLFANRLVPSLQCANVVTLFHFSKGRFVHNTIDVVPTLKFVLNTGLQCHCPQIKNGFVQRCRHLVSHFFKGNKIAVFPQCCIEWHNICFVEKHILHKTDAFDCELMGQPKISRNFLHNSCECQMNHMFEQCTTLLQNSLIRHWDLLDQ